MTLTVKCPYCSVENPVVVRQCDEDYGLVKCGNLAFADTGCGRTFVARVTITASVDGLKIQEPEGSRGEK